MGATAEIRNRLDSSVNGRLKSCRQESGRLFFFKRPSRSLSELYFGPLKCLLILKIKRLSAVLFEPEKNDF